MFIYLLNGKGGDCCKVLLTAFERCWSMHTGDRNGIAVFHSRNRRLVPPGERKHRQGSRTVYEATARASCFMDATSKQRRQPQCQPSRAVRGSRSQILWHSGALDASGRSRCDAVEGPSSRQRTPKDHQCSRVRCVCMCVSAKQPPRPLHAQVWHNYSALTAARPVR